MQGPPSVAGEGSSSAGNPTTLPLAHQLEGERGGAWVQTALDPKQKAMHETEGRWWVPDGDVAGRTITVRSPAEIIERLRSFPVTEASQKLGLMQNVRHYFSFDSKLTEPPNAVNVLMSGICKRAPQEPLNA